MPSMPAAFCADCHCSMRLEEVGVMLEFITKGGMSYYKVSADQHYCPNCGSSIFTGFGKPIEHFESNYKECIAQVTIHES